MKKVRPVVRCPLCEETTAAASLRIVGTSVEIECASCGASTRFPTYDTSITPLDREAFQDRTPLETPPGRGGAAPFEGEDTAKTQQDPIPDSFEEWTDRDVGPGRERLRRMASVVDGRAELPEELVKRYRRVVDSGDTANYHEKLLRYATSTNQLEKLGTIYRWRLELIPDDALSKKMRDRVVSAAMASLGPAPRSREQRGRRGVGKMTAVILLLAAALAGALLAALCGGNP